MQESQKAMGLYRVTMTKDMGILCITPVHLCISVDIRTQSGVLLHERVPLSKYGALNKY